VVKYINDEFKKIGSKNRMECVLTHGGEPWIVSLAHWQRAIERQR
jgi:Cys-Gly metallodipeptidase DUG1